MNRYFDIVYCIDLSEKMGDDLSWIKRSVRESYHLLNEHDWVKSLNDNICLRIKIVSFDDTHISESCFYDVYKENTLEKEYLQAHLKRLKVVGSSSVCNALESLKCAINSDWTTEQRKLHIVIVYTKSEIRNNAESKDSISLKSLINEVCASWYHPLIIINERKSKLSNSWLQKRLVLFAPYAEPRTQIYEYTGYGNCCLVGGEDWKIESEFVYDNIITSYYDPPI